jgi:hypothetical protein
MDNTYPALKGKYILMLYKHQYSDEDSINVGGRTEWKNCSGWNVHL